MIIRRRTPWPAFATAIADSSPTSPRPHRILTPSQRLALTNGQEPFAIVLGCSDSRVPAELVFDQGFGDLFVIRVAGNIVAPSQVGSVEFAAARFGTRLVVVMGHSQCGVVTAAVEEALGRTTNESRNLRSIVDRVRPSVETVVSGTRGIATSMRSSAMRCAPTCAHPSITSATAHSCSKA